MTKRATVLIVTATIMAFGLTKTAVSQETIRPVKLIEIEAPTRGVERHFFGQVVARQSVDLAFQVGGQISQFPVLEGQEINEGTLIAHLDLEPFRLQRDQARVQLQQAERTLARLDQLSDLSVSQATLDDTRTQVDLANIALRNAQYALDHATLYAPFDGLVSMRNVANFTTIGAGAPIVRFHDLSELRIEIDVPEILFQQAGRNPDVELTARFPASDEVFPLEIREYNAQASSVGQTFRLTLGLPRPEGLALLPGSSVTVSALLNSGNNGLVLPTSAIRLGNDGQAFAMVFHPTNGDLGRMEMRAIELQPTREGAFEILTGLQSGEQVALTGATDLNDGQVVRRFAGFAN